MAHSSRTWTGARTPQAQKRVRQAERRNAILQPRRTAAKTHVKNALAAAASGDAEMTATALAEAASALDRAAKVGAIHPNAAARRKSRLVRKANAALGGEVQVSGGKVQRQVSKAAAAKAKGEQTAAGKARAALSRSSRETGDTKSTASTTSTGSKGAASKTSAAKGVASKGVASKGAASKTSPAGSTASKSTATKSPKTSTSKAAKTTSSSGKSKTAKG